MSTTTTTSFAKPRVLTEELGGVRLALRDDITFTLQSFSGQDCYVVEDEARGSFFRIGVTEYMFLSVLDGNLTVDQAVARTAITMGPNAINDRDAAAICKWLIDNDLAQTNHSASASRLEETATSRQSRRWKAFLNPMVVMMRLGNPSPWLEPLLPITRWMFQPLGLIVWCIVCLWGATQVAIHFRELATSTVDVVSPNNWLWLGGAWLGLKLVHEAAHGLSCLTFGGRVRAFGVNSILFVPLPFIDVTSAWKLPSKWKRMFVAAAGMYAELYVAAIAAIVWSHTDVGMLRQLCWSIMLTGGLVTILFNANPLMRFDGYYILADWLELPNLAQHANHDVINLCKRWLFGVKWPPSNKPWKLRALIRIYGLLATAWKLTVTASLILGASAMFHGAGFVLSLLATVLWCLWPAIGFAKYVVEGNIAERPNRLRFAILSISMGMFGAWCWHAMPWTERLSFPAFVDYSPAVTVRSSVNGFVARVAITSGQLVNEGDVLIELDNPEIRCSISELKADIAKSEIRSHSYHIADDISARQVEDENRRALQRRLQEREQQQDQLIIRSPATGHVITSDIESLVGKYLIPGETLFVIGDEKTKRVQTLVTDADEQELQSRIGETVEVTFWSDSGRILSGRLIKLEPRASTELRHPALAATVGGPLPVRSRAVSDEQTPNQATEQWELLEPHFVASVALPDNMSQKLGAGQIGNVTFTTQRYSLGQHLTLGIRNWVERHRNARQ